MIVPKSASTSFENPVTPRASWRESLEVYLQRRVLIVLLLGFSSGLPLALSGSTLLVWMRESGVDLGTIGLFALVGTPYTLKFAWAPLVDALHVPFFTRAFGRRRGWLVCSQLLLIGAILLLALIGVNQWALAFAITAENFTSAIGTVIFVAYLSALCRNPLHTATQYALLTALSAVGRTYLSAGAGFVANHTGWPLFFVICMLVAIPSLVLLAWLQRRGHFEALGPVKV